MKSVFCLVFAALLSASSPLLIGQAATPEQIEAAREYLTSGATAPALVRKNAYVRTNSVPGQTRTSTRTMAAVPRVTHTPQGGMTPEMEQAAREILRKAMVPAHASAGPRKSSRPALPAQPTPQPAGLTPPVQPSSAQVPAETTVLSNPTPEPQLLATLLSDQDAEKAARQLLDEHRLAPEDEAAEVLRIEQAIDEAKLAQQARVQVAVSPQEAERMKEIARIEAEVLKAKERREKQAATSAVPAPPPAATPDPPATPAPPPAPENPPPPPPAPAEPSPAPPQPSTSGLEVLIPVTTSPVQSTLTPEIESRARAILEQSLNDTGSTGPTATRAQPAMALATLDVPAAPPQTFPGKTGATAPLPATPGLTGKQQRLAALLDAYKADLISASQYHQERARTLAEP